MYGDPGTVDVEPNDAESTQGSVSQSTPINCKCDNDNQLTANWTTTNNN